MDTVILEQTALRIAVAWLEQGVEARALLADEDIFPADYLAAQEDLGRELSRSEKRDLRAMVSEHLAGER